MDFFSLSLVILWWVRTMKAALFWLYLWQLKEYHIGRFIAHFSTAKGKRLLFNPLLIAKVILFGGAVFMPILIFAFIPVYAIEIFFKKTVLPVLTLKMRLLVGALVLLGSAIILVNNLFLLLVADILTPILVSIIVLGMQPTAVLARNRILAKARAKRREMKNLKVIGITGSYGKTSTKEFLAHILQDKFHVLKTPEHVNSEVGIARTILRSLTDVHNVFVCEMGAYGKGGIKLLADLVQPDMGMITGVNEQHLATFGSKENLLSAEGGEELAKALPEEAALFVNVHSRLKGDLKGATIKEYGDAENISIKKDRVSFSIDGVSFDVPAYGRHNVQNILGAIAVAKEMGMTLEEISERCESFSLELSALRVKEVDGLTVIDSTYSSNPDGVIADLEYMSLYDGKKIIVMPCLIELGAASAEVHKLIGGKIAEVCDLGILTTTECKNAVQEGAKDTQIIYTENAVEIVERIKEITEQKGVVLLEGGKESRVQLQLLSKLLHYD